MENIEYSVKDYLANNNIDLASSQIDINSENMTKLTFIQILQECIKGVQAIHQAGYVHRDIKPDNIRIRKNNTVVLIDLGGAVSYLT
jgi:serine/threonine protein kinase